MCEVTWTVKRRPHYFATWATPDGGPSMAHWSKHRNAIFAECTCGAAMTASVSEAILDWCVKRGSVWRYLHELTFGVHHAMRRQHELMAAEAAR